MNVQPTRVWMIPGETDVIVDNGTDVPIGLGPAGVTTATDLTPYLKPETVTFGPGNGADR